MSDNPVRVIAIDGPSASGKSTVTRMTAQKLGCLYVDSGSFYRGITWKALRDGLDTADAEQVIALINRMEMTCHIQDKSVMFSIDNEEPGDQIRSQPVQEHVSDIAAVPEVRVFVVSMLRDTARFGSVAMEGRDIGTVVFPDTPYKYYLDADPEERARRRFGELADDSGYQNVEAVYASLKRRDRKDTTRTAAPLQIALGAKVIDSTTMTADEVVDIIVADIYRLEGTAA